MNIGIDVSLMSGCNSGTEEYIEGLLSGLSTLGCSIRGLTPLKQPIRLNEPCLGLSELPKRSLLSKLIWETWGITRNVRDLDVVHIPYMSHPPRPLLAPTIVTVHDTIPYRFTHYNSRVRERLYFSMIKKNLEHSQGIVAISTATKRDIEQFLPMLSGKVTVIPNGVHYDFFRPKVEKISEQVSEIFRLRDHPRILYVGGYDDRKNVSTLLKAVRIVFHQLQVGELILVGAARKEKVQREIERLGIGNFVKSTDYLSRTDLVTLYQNSDVFAFPSVYEGFGLPPAQALATGTPVIAGNTPAVAEVLQDHGLLVDDIYSAEAWSQALLKVIEDGSLRRQMGKSGRVRAQEFWWESIAKRYLALYREIANSENV